MTMVAVMGAVANSPGKKKKKRFSVGFGKDESLR